MAFGAVNPTGYQAPSTGYRRTSSYKQPEITEGPGANALGGGRTNRNATAGAKAFKDSLGLPDYEDLLGKLGGGGSTREFGNAGRAGEGADYFRKELDAQKGNINRARAGIRNPTGTAGFKAVMRLTNERLGNEAENDRRLGAEAASRRGYVGGYSGERLDQDRRERAATAGYEGAASEREAQQKLFEGETGLYGTQAGAYTDLTKTAAELPTKWLDSYSNLLGGLSGGFGDIFGTASRNVQFDTGNEREDVANRSRAYRGTQGRLLQGATGGI